MLWPSYCCVFSIVLLRFTIIILYHPVFVIVLSRFRKCSIAFSPSGAHAQRSFLWPCKWTCPFWDFFVLYGTSLLYFKIVYFCACATEGDDTLMITQWYVGENAVERWRKSDTRIMITQYYDIKTALIG